MKLVNKIKKIFHPQATIAATFGSIVRDSEHSLLFNIKRDELMRLAYQSTETGVSNAKLAKEEIVVSLTTFGSRFYDAYLAIESIMQGSVKPNRIVMWVSEDFKGVNLPQTLQNQMKRGLEIRFCRDIRSYTKLIYSLKEFPNASIITIDDDILYQPDTIENLVRVHNEQSDVICCNIVKPLKQDFIQHPVTYTQIEMAEQYKTICDKYILEGYAGVLYPPHSFSEEVFNEDVFMDICKYADDIWFSCMAMLNHTKAIKAYPHLGFYRFLNNNDVQSIALQNNNVRGEVLNDKQLMSVLKKYDLLCH